MVLSLFSVALLLVAAFVIIIGVMKAIGKGLKKSLISLATILLSIFLALIVARPLSNLFVAPIGNLFRENINFSSIESTLPSLPNIVDAYSASVVGPLVFLVLFILFKIIASIVVSVILRSRVKKKIEDDSYENEEAPAYKKNPKIVSGLIGFFASLLMITTVISPIMGTLKVADKTFVSVNQQSEIYGAKINSTVVSGLTVFSRDLVGTGLYYCGGNLIYRLSATSMLNDNYFQLENESVQTLTTADDLLRVTSILGNITSSTQEQRDSMKVLGKEINKAETLKTIAGDIVPQLSINWLDGKQYLGVNKPKFNTVSESVFNKMLYVCKSSTVDTVGNDLNTLLNVYMIAYENGILISTDYKSVVEIANRTGAFDLIREELNKNPRMAGISVDIDTMAIRSIASAIQSFNLDNYDLLMNNIMNTLNVATRYEGEERIQYITDLTRHYIDSYGLDIGSEETKKLAEKLNQEIIGNKKSVTVDEIKAFWDKYSVKVKDSGSTQTQTPSVSIPGVGDLTIDANNGITITPEN